MNDFLLWFSMGFEHIANWEAYDHILFLIVLCGVYQIKQWKTTLILITAFTIGHCITLALSTLHIIQINDALIEFLIPVTIVITAISNIMRISKKTHSNSIENNKAEKHSPLLFSRRGAGGEVYFFALSFGLIHGLGFSNVLRSLLGKSESIVFPLFSFNIGLEIGQIVVVLIVLLFSLALYSFLKINTKTWTILISILVLIPSIIISLNRLMELINL